MNRLVLLARLCIAPLCLAPLCLAPLCLAACGNPAAPTPVQTRVADAPASPAATGAPEHDYLGIWIGVEGMFLNVTKRTGGGVTLEMQWDLDHKGTFAGSVTPQGLRFTRDGKDEIAVLGNGDATGLKWLAGKKDCLTVKPGEGYCR